MEAADEVTEVVHGGVGVRLHLITNHLSNAWTPVSRAASTRIYAITGSLRTSQTLKHRHRHLAIALNLLATAIGPHPNILVDLCRLAQVPIASGGQSLNQQLHHGTLLLAHLTVTTANLVQGANQSNLPGSGGAGDGKDKKDAKVCECCNFQCYGQSH